MLEAIPNNVNLSDDPKLQRALLRWQPQFKEWWMDMGPDGFQKDDIYLRTAVSVEPGGWAHWDYVKLPDYQFGIFLAPQRKVEEIYFGDNIGRKLWTQVPGEFRKELRRLIVTQGDTEPASVEQQRHLGKTAPSLIDLRALFQVNVEEARHLWAMVYLLHSHFGADGRAEAEELLQRRSGHPDHPRILQAFNKPIRDWLAFFCFTTFTDRDGKFQLASLAESSFDPLARTTNFMLTEEAFHLATGEKGVGRVIERTAQLMRDGTDPASVGAIPLSVIQKYINEWSSATFDLFGAEDSSNAATFFAAGLKGRYQEGTDKRCSDHVALEGAYEAQVYEHGQWTRREIPKRRAMNAYLLDAYADECTRVVGKWNKILEKYDLGENLTLPSLRFNRKVGIYSDQPYDAHGQPITQAALDAEIKRLLPNQVDYDLVERSMVPVLEPGKVANWIAPPEKGVGSKSVDFDYVRFH